MKKTNILQENLQYGLHTVSYAVGSGTVLPVLSNVLLEADASSNRLRLTASDLEVRISVSLGARVGKGFATTTPYKTLSDLVGTMGGQIVMHLNSKETLDIRDAITKGKIKGIEASEFPPERVADDTDTSIEVSGKKLQDMIQKVAFAASSDTTRPMLTGVLIKLLDSELTMVALDGLRLAQTEQAVDIDPKHAVKAIIPVTSMKKLARIIGDETVQISFVGDSAVVFRGGNVELTTLTLNGEFPDYEKVIPEEL
ncbi:MAG: DNA polymerase III subunit beta, partial [Chloroflexota bacterium]|nr:DNA polymerase III subunit beta [Chloroflexota bacterium]